jgi:hypothetical protein
VKPALLRLLVTLCSCVENGSPEPAWGATVVVRISGPHEDLKRVKDADRIIDKRLYLAGFQHGRASAQGPVMTVRVHGADPSNTPRRLGHRIGGNARLPRNGGREDSG